MKLNEIIQFDKGLSIPRDRTSINFDIPYLHYGDIYKLYNNRIDMDLVHNNIIKIRSNEKIKTSQQLNNGDIVMNLTSENYEDLGKSVIIFNKNNLPFVAGMETYRFRVINDLILPEYLLYFFQSRNFGMQLSQLVTGMKVYRANPKHFDFIKVPTMSISTQQHIVDIIQN